MAKLQRGRETSQGVIVKRESMKEPMGKLRCPRCGGAAISTVQRNGQSLMCCNGCGRKWSAKAMKG